MSQHSEMMAGFKEAACARFMIGLCLLFWIIGFGIFSFIHQNTTEKQFNAQTTLIERQTALIKNISEQLSAIQAGVTIIPNPEKWEEDK